MSVRALDDLAEILAARTGHHLDDACAHLYDYVRAVGLVSAPVGASTVRDDVADALLQAPIPGLTTDLNADRWRYALVPLCGFCPSGRDCPNVATVVVTVPGADLPYALVPTCGTCLPDWNDEVAATAVPVTGLITSPAAAVRAAGGAR